MVTDGFYERMLERIASAMGMTVAEQQQYQKDYMAELNERLEKQMANQRMTPDVLAKRCTL